VAAGSAGGLYICTEIVTEYVCGLYKCPKKVEGRIEKHKNGVIWAF
jgi:hypothetical protein